MTNSLNKYDILVVKFPFSNKEVVKARPVVVISSAKYNSRSRDDVLVMAISSSFKNKLKFEGSINNWKKAGLLKPSFFKAAVSTVNKVKIITKLGTLSKSDRLIIDNQLSMMFDV